MSRDRKSKMFRGGVGGDFGSGWRDEEAGTGGFGAFGSETKQGSRSFLRALGVRCRVWLQLHMREMRLVAFGCFLGICFVVSVQTMFSASAGISSKGTGSGRWRVSAPHPDVSLVNGSQVMLTVPAKQEDASLKAWDCAKESIAPVQQHVKLVVVILSHGGNALARRAVRDTWVNEWCKPEFGIVCKFVVGAAGKAKAAQEAERFKDILFTETGDSYLDLVPKNLDAWRQVLDEFSFDHMLKTDDDAYINLPKLMESLRGLPKRQLLYSRWDVRDSSLKVLTEGKWANPEFVSDTGLLKYPRKVQGCGYLMSADLVQFAVRSPVPMTDYWPIEDASLTTWTVGLQLFRVHDERILFWPWEKCEEWVQDPWEELAEPLKQSDAIVYHHMRPGGLRLLHECFIEQHRVTMSPEPASERKSTA